MCWRVGWLVGRRRRYLELGEGDTGRTLQGLEMRLIALPLLLLLLLLLFPLLLLPLLAVLQHPRRYLVCERGELLARSRLLPSGRGRLPSPCGLWPSVLWTGPRPALCSAHLSLAA